MGRTLGVKRAADLGTAVGSTASINFHATLPRITLTQEQTFSRAVFIQADCLIRNQAHCWCDMSPLTPSKKNPGNNKRKTPPPTPPPPPPPARRLPPLILRSCPSFWVVGPRSTGRRWDAHLQFRASTSAADSLKCHSMLHPQQA